MCIIILSKNNGDALHFRHEQVIARIEELIFSAL